MSIMSQGQPAAGMQAANELQAHNHACNPLGISVCVVPNWQPLSTCAELRLQLHLAQGAAEQEQGEAELMQLGHQGMDRSFSLTRHRSACVMQVWRAANSARQGRAGWG